MAALFPAPQWRPTSNRRLTDLLGAGLAKASIPNAQRAIALRALGRRLGPVTRVFGPNDIGSTVKPFVFLDCP